MSRLTKRELDAISLALDIVLRSEVIDGYDDDSDDEANMRSAMRSAFTKVQERLT